MRIVLINSIEPSLIAAESMKTRFDRDAASADLAN